MILESQNINLMCKNMVPKVHNPVFKTHLMCSLNLSTPCFVQGVEVLSCSVTYFLLLGAISHTPCVFNGIHISYVFYISFVLFSIICIVYCEMKTNNLELELEFSAHNVTHHHLTRQMPIGNDYLELWKRAGLSQNLSFCLLWPKMTFGIYSVRRKTWCCENMDRKACLHWFVLCSLYWFVNLQKCSKLGIINICCCNNIIYISSYLWLENGYSACSVKMFPGSCRKYENCKQTLNLVFVQLQPHSLVWGHICIHCIFSVTLNMIAFSSK